MTSRPLKYIVRKLVHPEKEDRVFHPDEVYDHTFEGFGLYWEADAVARCLRGEQQGFQSIGVETTGAEECRWTPGVPGDDACGDFPGDGGEL
jgi:hypothetical protein